MQDTGEQYPLTKSEHRLLLSLVNCRNKQSRKVFDKKDNCFTKPSIREIAEVTDHSRSSIGRLFKKLNDLHLLKYVTNSQGDSVRMLSPFFMPLTSRKIDKKFKYAMFTLGSHSKACEWSKRCREDGFLYDLGTFTLADVIDFETGEVIPQRKTRRALTMFEVKEWEKYRLSYSCTDRTKRRPAKKA